MVGDVHLLHRIVREHANKKRIHMATRDHVEAKIEIQWLDEDHVRLSQALQEQWSRQRKAVGKDPCL